MVLTPAERMKASRAKRQSTHERLDIMLLKKDAELLAKNATLLQATKAEYVTLLLNGSSDTITKPLSETLSQSTQEQHCYDSNTTIDAKAPAPSKVKVETPLPAKDSVKAPITNKGNYDNKALNTDIAELIGCSPTSGTLTSNEKKPAKIALGISTERGVQATSEQNKAIFAWIKVNSKKAISK